MQTNSHRVNPTRTDKTFTKTDAWSTSTRRRKLRKMVPMSSEMKEVLSGLARFDLLPDGEQRDQLLALPGVDHNRRTKGKTRTDRNNNKIASHNKHLYRESGRKFTSTNQLRQSYPSSGDRSSDVFLRSRQDYGFPRRSRSSTTPWSYHFNGEETKITTTKQSLRPTVSLGTPIEKTVHESEDFFNDICRPRAATFPLSIQHEQNELLSPSGSQSERHFHDGSRSATSTQRMTRYHRTSQEELDGIVGRCENWFAMRGFPNQNITTRRIPTKNKH